MKREVKPVGYQVEHLDSTDFAADVVGWFQKQTDVGDGNWFLAHADDGVIWGQTRNGQLIVSSSIFSEISPPLQATTLQQARLFGELAEVRVWRDGKNFRACCLRDHADEGAEAFDEEHLLWGTSVEEQRDNFTLVAEGRQGLRHAVPFAVSSLTPLSQNRRLRLRVRHYLAYDNNGQVYVSASRLVTLGDRPGREHDEP